MPHQEQRAPTVPTCDIEVQPHQDLSAVGRSPQVQAFDEASHQAQPHVTGRAGSPSGINSSKPGKIIDPTKGPIMDFSHVEENVALGQPLQTGEAASSNINGKIMSPETAATIHTENIILNKQPHPAAEAALTSKSQDTDKTGSEETVTIPIEELHKMRKLRDRLESVMFNTEATLAVAQHFIMTMPYRKLPMAVNFDGSTFDPNPQGSRDPVEVAHILAALSDHTGGDLRAIYCDVTGLMSAPYEIPAKLISKAMRRDDGESYADKVRLQFLQEYNCDPQMKSMVGEVGAVLDHNLGPPPPRRLAVQPAAVTPSQDNNLQTPVKKEAGSQNHAAATASVSGSPTQDKAKAKAKTRPKTNPAEAHQKYRENNNVVIMLEASPLDIIRTHRTQKGRQLWGEKGFIWPEVASTATDVSPETWALMSKKLARYCTATHASGWLVLISGDIGNCHECNHQNLVVVDIYLPPKSRFNILQRNYGINESDQVFVLSTRELTEQPNNIRTLPNLSSGFRDEGTIFRRRTLLVPMEVQDAISQGKINELFRKRAGTLTPVDQYLMSSKNVPKMSKRKLENKVKAGLGLANYTAYENKYTNASMTAFHIRRLQHFWDMSEFSEKKQRQIVERMLQRIQSLHADKSLTSSKFDPEVHWFVRNDFVEMLHSKTLDSLLIELTGQPDPSITAAKIKKEKEDPDLAHLDHTRDDVDTTTSRKRKASDDQNSKPPRKRKSKAKKVEQNEFEDDLMFDSDAERNGYATEEKISELGEGLVEEDWVDEEP